MTDLLGPGAFGAARAAAIRPTLTPGNGAGDPDTWAQDCSSPTANDGTENRAGLFNMLISQLRRVIRKSGVAANNTDDDMLARAVRSQRLNYISTPGGTANAITATIDPAPASYSDLAGTPLRLIPVNGNTGATTININGLGTIPIRKDGAAALAANDLIAGRLVELVYDGVNFQLLTAPVLPFSNRQVFTASGAFTPPAGVTRARVRVWGAGGGSGGSTGSGSASVAGAGGGYAEGIVAITPGVDQTVTVGTGGSAGVGGGTPTAGGNGGTSSFGSLISATGGAGGVGASGAIATGAAAAGTGVGGDVNLSGQGGGQGFQGVSGYIAGFGGAAFGGSTTGPSTSTVSANGIQGSFPGGGACGSLLAANGGPGANGLVIVEY